MHERFNTCRSLNLCVLNHLCLAFVVICLFDFCSIPFTSILVHSQCSKTCGRGLRKRSVFCQSTDPGAKAVVVPDSMCRQHHKPKAQETCVLRRCPKNERLQWIPTPWGEVRQERCEAQDSHDMSGFQFNYFEEKWPPKALKIC